MIQAPTASIGVRRRRDRFVAACGVVLAGLLVPAAFPHRSFAAALEQFGGWEGDSRGQGFGFAGAAVSLPARGAVRIPVSISGSFLYYNYDSAGTHITVRSPGTSLMAGIRAGGSRGSLSLMGGGETRWERRKTGASATSMAMRPSFSAVVQTYDDLALSRRWYASAFGIYVGAAQYLIGRAALRYQVTNSDWKRPRTFFAGIEGIRQGNDESDAIQAGGLAEWNLVPQRLSLGLHSGYKESWSPGYAHKRGGYAGISFYRGF